MRHGGRRNVGISVGTTIVERRCHVDGTGSKVGKSERIHGGYAACTSASVVLSTPS